MTNNSKELTTAQEPTPMTPTTTSSNNSGLKTLILIRHARSEGNEFLSRPGNQWGDPTFRDDANLIDAKLTDTGMQQVQDELLPTLLLNANNLLEQVELVLVSPLTRTQQTFQYGVLPALQKLRPNNMPPILAQPLSTERVYTASDTGRDTQSLKTEFPWVDWSLVEEYDDQHWWYTLDDDTSSRSDYQEWRPHGQGQWYAVPGEPQEVFERRMKTLEEWIAAREERTILLVVHWGVIGYLTGGYDSHNCEVKVLENWKPLHKSASFL